MGRKSGKKGNKSGKKNNNFKNINNDAIVPPQEEENITQDNEVAVVETSKRVSAQRRKNIAKRKREELALIEERSASTAAEENVSDDLNSIDASSEVKSDEAFVESSDKDVTEDDLNSVESSNEVKNDQVLVESLDKVVSEQQFVRMESHLGDFSGKPNMGSKADEDRKVENEEVVRIVGPLIQNSDVDPDSGDILIDSNSDRIENQTSTEENDDSKMKIELSRCYTSSFIMSLRDRWSNKGILELHNLKVSEDLIMPKKQPSNDEKNVKIENESSRCYTNEFLLSLRDRCRGLETRGSIPKSLLTANPTNYGMAKPLNLLPAFGKSSSKIESRENKPVMRFSLSVRADAELKTSENAWRPSRVATSGELTEDEEKTKALYKSFRALLNKLTPEKFEVLVNKMMKLEIDTCGRLRGIIDMIFEKSVSEPGFSTVYSKLCRTMFTMKVPSDNETGATQLIGFSTLLVGRCQREFEKGNEDDECRNRKLKEIQSCPDVVEKEVLQQEFDEYVTNMRKKSVGTIRFIGELYKEKMLTENIMFTCLKTLIRARDEESLECLCKLLATVGHVLDMKIRQSVSKILNEMEQIASNKTSKISSRIRFMLLDTIDLRLNGWKPRMQTSALTTLIKVNKDIQNEHMPRISLPAQKYSKPMKPRKESEDGWKTIQQPRKINVESGRLKRTETLPAMNEVGKTKPFQNWGNVSETTRRQSTSNTNIFYSNNRRDSHAGNFQSDSMRNRQLDNIRGSRSSGQYRSCDSLNSSNMRSDNYSDTRRKNFPKQSLPPHQRTSNVSFAEPNYRHRPATSNLRKAASTRSIGDTLSNEKPNSLSKAVSTMSVAEVSFKDKSTTNLRKAVSTLSIVEPTTKPEIITRAMVEKYESAFKNTVEEYCAGNCKIEDCQKELRDIPGSLLPQMLEDTLLTNLEHSRNSRVRSSEVFASLVKNEIVVRKDFIDRLRSVISYWEDFIIDIPTFWEYLGEVLAPLVHEEVILLNELSTLLDDVAKNKFGPKLLATIGSEIFNASGNLRRLSLEAIWKKSDAKLDYFVLESEVESFVEKNRSWLQNCMQ